MHEEICVMPWEPLTIYNPQEHTNVWGNQIMYTLW